MNYDLLKGCLVWFWNKETDRKLGVLAEYDPESPYPYYEMNGGCYRNCEPAEYKEVKFYNENPMKSVYLSAKEKAEQGIINAVDSYLQDAKQQYEDFLPNTNIAMENDYIHNACGESDEVCEAIRKYMELI